MKWICTTLNEFNHYREELKQGFASQGCKTEQINKHKSSRKNEQEGTFKRKRQGYLKRKKNSASINI